MSKDIDPEELATNAQRLREVVTEAHAAIKDLTHLLRDFKEAAKQAEANLNAIKDVAVESVDDRAFELVDQVVKSHMDTLGPELRATADKAHTIILAQFDELFQLLMNGGKGADTINDVRVLMGMPKDKIVMAINAEEIQHAADHAASDLTKVVRSTGQGLPNFKKQIEEES